MKGVNAQAVFDAAGWTRLQDPSSFEDHCAADVPFTMVTPATFMEQAQLPV